MLYRENNETGEWCRREPLILNKLNSFPRLQRALEIWRVRQDPAAFEMLENATIIDASTESPHPWLFKSYGGRFFKSLASPYLRDHPSPMAAETALGDYLQCKHSQQPHACIGDDNILDESGNWIERNFARILLPLPGGQILNVFQHIGDTA